MPTPTGRQRRRAKKATRQKKRQRKRAAGSSDRGNPILRREARARRLGDAASWPLHEVLISKGWDDPHQLVQVFVARRGPGGRVAAATFLVDLGCLGAKDGFARVFPDVSTYRALRSRVRSNMPMAEGIPALAAKIVREGIRYARELGFEPHADAAAALPILGGIGDSPIEVPLGGEDGRPFYMQGPHDDARRILDRLDGRLRHDGYHFVVRGDESGPLGPEDGPDELDAAWEDEDCLATEGEAADREAEDRATADAGHLLVEFAGPLLGPDLRTAKPEAVEATLRLATAVWNAMVMDQLSGTQAAFPKLREELLRLTGVDRVPMRALLETMRERKLSEYPEDLVRFKDVRVTEGQNGDFGIDLRVARLLSDEEG